MKLPRPAGAGLALGWAVQIPLSVALFGHLRDQLNPDAVAYGRAAQLWLQGKSGLALNATWGVLEPWSAVPGLACGLDPGSALRAGQIVAALGATAGVDAFLRCFEVHPPVRAALVVAAALYGATASTMVLTSDASFVATFVWMCVALVTKREAFAGLPRPVLAGLLGGLGFLARPVGLPMGIAMIVTAELARGLDEGWAPTARRTVAFVLAGWALVAIPWTFLLSVHYGKFTTTHSPRLVHAAVGPHLDHPWNLPSFTRVHLPPPGRITTWEDPSVLDLSGLEWSPFESPAAWEHQVGLLRRNLRAITAELVAFDGDGMMLASLLIVPLLGLVRPRRGVGWREPWLLVCLLLHLAALAPLHVERRYLWPLFPLGLAALGSLATRMQDCVASRGAVTRVVRLTTAIVSLLILLPPIVVNGVRVLVLLMTPARREQALALQWATAVRRVGREGPIVSWSPHRWKALDAEGLYLAWTLDRPWLGNLAGDGSDLADAVALGAEVVVAKVGLSEPAPPAWLRSDWAVVATSDVENATLRDGRYFVMVRR